ncbi:MAG: PEP-CTERM/exosortase system-associated acyltransferase [Halioglobus sp.]
MSAISEFGKYFSVSLATTPEERTSAYRIRYRVYCEEFKYFPPDLPSVADPIECDEFDSRSLHCLVTHKSSGIVAGCVRVVTTQSSMYEDPLPLEKYCADGLSLEALELLNLDRKSMGEISRLAVDPQFRRRRGACSQLQEVADGVSFSPEEKRVFSAIAVAGLMAAAAISELMDKTTIFAMMDPALPRLLRASGMSPARIGREVNYYGPRTPYCITAQSFHEEISSELRSFYYDTYSHFETEYADIIGQFGRDYSYAATVAI